MKPHNPAQVASQLLSRHNCTLVTCVSIQRLWAGYGSICAITARANSDEAAKHIAGICDPNSDSLASGKARVKKGDEFKLILKLITAPESSGRGIDEGHLRKMFSYEVERYFYEVIVPELDGLDVARCLALTGNGAQSRDGPVNLEEEEEGEEEGLRGCMAILMADLRNLFPVSGEKRSILSSVQVFGSLEWLAKFHARSWELGIGLGGRSRLGSRSGSGFRDGDGEVNGEQGFDYILPPLEEHARREKQKQVGGDIGQNVWLNGGYTYLSTRRKEYDSLAEDDSEWSSAFCHPFSSSTAMATGTGLRSTAEVVALCLTPRGRAMESLIHGDVKSENLFTSVSGEKVAFFDFQYVGLGLGVCDLAKLFTCSVSVDMLLASDFEDHLVPDSLPMCSGEKELLERYRETLLRSQSQEFYDWDIFLRHWETALVDWCRFQASWGFWGNTEWLEARVRFILNDQGWRDWLENDIKKMQSLKV